MLKLLELIGFKSFADKTRFEFPPGITTIVGPNGSGKSNVVDAVKWVLGEQSAKSLRGREMADVIFNGSGSRPAMNTAEVTLTFDNRDGVLHVDSPEVHITRRVYRSGEGEYLINRQPCRLRDIRDLFAGTGVAQHAYSVIEQGKVAALLDASAADRRLIFEEAAGISRFRARKLETQRRLERVEQNLLRLKDIVDEVENRLRSVRLQAAKARRYREYTNRLQELRIWVGLADFNKLTEALEGHEQALAALRDQHETALREAQEEEQQAAQLDDEMRQTADLVRALEARIAANRERIAANESTLEHERGRSRDLEEEIERHRRRLAAMSVRSGDLQQQLEEIHAALSGAEVEHREAAAQLAADEQQFAQLDRDYQASQADADTLRSAHTAAIRSAAALHNQIGALQSQQAAAESARQRAAEQRAQCQQSQQQLEEQQQRLAAQQQQLEADYAQRQARLAAAQQALADDRSQQASRREALSQLRQRHAAATERAALLEELEKHLEGVNAGVKDLLQQARSGQPGPWQAVVGLVADLFQVQFDTASLIEIALGEAAGYLVVRQDGSFWDHLASLKPELKGRVGFVPLEIRSELPPVADLDGLPGVVTRADRLVETEPQFAPLRSNLLGRTWIVENLASALVLAHGAGRGQRFVTTGGELVQPDGAVVIGPRSAASGLISRRSELRVLQQQVTDLAAAIAQGEEQLAGLGQRVEQGQHQVETLADQLQPALRALGEHRALVQAAGQQRAELERQLQAIESQQRAALSQQEAAAAALAEARQKHQQAEHEAAELEQRAAAARQHLAALRQQRETLSAALTARKVRVAKSEERLESLRAQLAQLERDQQERQRVLREHQSHLAQCGQRASQCRWAMLHLSTALAELYLRKDQLAAEVHEHRRRREELQRQRHARLAGAAARRESAHEVEQAIHREDLAASEIRLQRNNLVARLQEDYDVDLATLEHEPSEEEIRQRAEVESEIAELRRKIGGIGNVNLDALAELEELEQRHSTLCAQYDDLVAAKNALEKIIQRINADSRRLFSETLETVTMHFKDLFRKLFGGGSANIALEEGVDLLEAGIEIVACPPGKEPRNISLLSGGEKTLTCVALLLAIFRSRPSPFCILDEVDAALDEANIERFINVLREFVSWTQFIVVTHSKKTMTCANTLYGVTMQESGVSKRVSVRFDDVSDNGEIQVSSQPSAGDSDFSSEDIQAA